MSTPSIEAPSARPGGGRGAAWALGFGILFLVIAIAGYFGRFIGLPFGFHAAASWAVGLAGVGLILPVFIPFKALQDYAAGMFLVVLAAVGIMGTLTLNFQTSTGVGPGMMPRATGLLVGAFGIMLIINGLFAKGDGLDRWSIRGIVFVLGSALLFAWTIRPLGLIVAGPLAVMFSAFADRDTKWLEVMIFAVIMTFACIGLFSYGLKLPIPIWPSETPWVPYVGTIKF